MPAKKKLVSEAFGKYVPKSFEKVVRSQKPASAGEKEREYFLRQMHSDRALTSKEEQQRFARGFLKEAHAEDAKLSQGYNPSGHEYAQAQRLVKTYAAKTATPDGKPGRQSEPSVNPLQAVRERLGIQHSALGQPAPPAPSWQAPTPLSGSQPGPHEPGAGTGWASPSKTSDQGSAPTKSARTPSFGPPATGLTGGHVTLPKSAASAVGRAIPAPTPHGSSVGGLSHAQIQGAGGHEDSAAPNTGEYFEISNVPSPITANTAVNLTVRAIDRNGQLMTNYSGDAALVPKTGPGSMLPEMIALTHGEWTGQVICLVPYEKMSFTVADASTSPLRLGISNTFAVYPGAEPDQTPSSKTSDLPDMSQVHEMPI